MATAIKSPPLIWQTRIEASTIRLPSVVPLSPTPPCSTAYHFADGSTWTPPKPIPARTPGYFAMAGEGNGSRTNSAVEDAAKQAMRRRQYSAAIDFFQQALTEQVDKTGKLSGATLCDLGICLRQSGRRADAVQALSLANQWNEHSRTWCELAITHREAGDFAAARSAITKGLALNEQRAILVPYMYVMHAELQYAAGQTMGAIHILRRLCAALHQFRLVYPTPQVLLIAYLLHMQQYDEADRLLHAMSRQHDLAENLRTVWTTLRAHLEARGPANGWLAQLMREHAADLQSIRRGLSAKRTKAVAAIYRGRIEGERSYRTQ